MQAKIAFYLQGDKELTLSPSPVMPPLLRQELANRPDNGVSGPLDSAKWSKQEP